MTDPLPLDRRKPANAYINWDRIERDWLDGYRPQVIADRENQRRAEEGEHRRITATRITDHASLVGWEKPWKLRISK